MSIRRRRPLNAADFWFPLLLIAVAAVVGFWTGQAHAQTTFNVTATMPATAGATSCQLYLDGAAAGTPKPCDSAQSYPGLVESPGVYAFTYRALNASGQSALSPVRTVTIAVIPPPADPSEPPTMVITCNPAPCSLLITVDP